jgi:hypothetical protein
MSKPNKNKLIKPLEGHTAVSDDDVVSRGTAVVTGLTGNTHFTTLLLLSLLSPPLPVLRPMANPIVFRVRGRNREIRRRLRRAPWALRAEVYRKTFFEAASASSTRAPRSVFSNP